MTGLDDLFYPDNSNRKKRVEQLMSQCADLTNEIADNKIKIDELLQMVSETVRNEYKNIGIKNIEYEKINIAPDWYVTLPKTISLGVFATWATKSMKILADKIFIAYLLKQGRIGEAAFSKLVGLPKWFKFGGTAGSAVGGLVITVAIEAVIDAIIGANVRDKLQNAIKVLAKPRIELLYTKLLSDYAKDVLTGIKTQIELHSETLRESGIVLDEKQLKALINGVSEKVVETMEKLNKKPTRKTALEEFQKKDKFLNAWTIEDPSNEEFKKIVEELEEANKKQNI
ncbi:hypothetical protein SPE26_23095 [Bacillus thuringiensis]|uniref:Uncharacterized protein n=1 Tax=Bacillus thuringiensis TaxID=1428 RepID=A0AAW9GMI6_BACTU|nr:hypothetical protein [Bacillus thuringiensis]MDY0854740.1 hypothetical protein [Bacillus thuringiensis]MDY4393620.1 hypothetical protein [Bacillus thuringiensis]